MQRNTGFITFRKFLEALAQGSDILEFLNMCCKANVKSPWPVYKISSGWLEKVFSKRDIRAVRRALARGPWQILCWGSNGERDAWVYFVHRQSAMWYLLRACGERQSLIGQLPKVALAVENAIRHAVVNSWDEFLDLVLTAMPSGLLLLRLDVNELPPSVREEYPELIDYLKALGRDSKLHCIDPCREVGRYGVEVVVK